MPTQDFLNTSLYFIPEISSRFSFLALSNPDDLGLSAMTIRPAAGAGFSAYRGR